MSHDEPTNQGIRVVDAGQFSVDGPGRPGHARSSDADPARFFTDDDGWNLYGLPRSESPKLTGFAKLRQLARDSDLVKACIGTQRHELMTVDWAVVARPGIKYEVTDLTQDIERFLATPDRLSGFSWAQWVGSILEEMLVTDAVSVRVIRDRAGRVHSFFQVDGSTIKPILSRFRTRPQPPAPAFQQVDSGVIVSEYTTDQLYYAPQDVTVTSPYGCSPVEKALVAIETAILAFSDHLAVYDESTLPQVYVQIPEGSTMDEAKCWIDLMNDVVANDRSKRFKFLPVPPGANVKELRPQVFDQTQMEWLARNVCNAFGVSPMALVNLMSRATAAVSETAQYDVGLAPRKSQIEHIVNDLIRMGWGDAVADTIEFVFVTDKSDISLERMQTLDLMIRSGVVRSSWVSEQVLGLDPDEEIQALPIGGVQSSQPAMPVAFAASPSPELSKAARDDLKRWRKIARKSRQRALGFVSDAIPVPEQDRVRTALKTEEPVDAIFKHEAGGVVHEHKAEGSREFRSARKDLEAAAADFLDEQRRELTDDIVRAFAEMRSEE